MTARLSEAGRISGKRAVAGMTLAAAATALVLTTGFPAENVLGGGSAALAELVARSPGARIGGIALKAKAPRSRVAPTAAAAPPASAGPALAAAPNPAALGAGTVPALGFGPSSGFGSPVVLPADSVPSVLPGSLSTASGPTPGP